MTHKYTIVWTNGKVSSFLGGEPKEGDKAFHVDSDGCRILIPYAWYRGGEVKEVA